MHVIILHLFFQFTMALTLQSLSLLTSTVGMWMVWILCPHVELHHMLFFPQVTAKIFSSRMERMQKPHDATLPCVE